ncbi:hypothetical protein EYZ11_013144 [Aspergillus tanneri]|nr:hypothetical protein EYZ11_013144 [Aspergillus tanneri]
MIRPRRNWTTEEDMILRREVGKAQASGRNISWHEIAAFLPGRTNKDCRKRWYGTTAAKVNKGPWTEAEDERLIKAIKQHGTKWAIAASVVGSRLPDQCSKRWSHAINPEIDHSPWTPQEDELLLQGVTKHGHFWQQLVSLYFPRRTSLSAKNRYHVLQRRLKNGSDPAIQIGGSEVPLQFDYQQEMLKSREQNRQLGLESWGSSDQDLCPISTAPEELMPMISHSLSHSPIYGPPSDFDNEPMGCLFQQSEPGTCSETFPTLLQMDLDRAFPSPLTHDDLRLGATQVPTATSRGSSSLPDSNLRDQSKSSSTQRKVTIQVVCSNDNLGAIFQAVTELSISAVFKTDE